MSRNSAGAVWPTDGTAKTSGLDRVVILVVDEILKTRALLGSILSSLGVGTVLRAPNGGNALELIHEAPAHAWSIGELACKVGMSRSAFAGRFKALVSDTPMQYLTRWRMHRATHLLRTEGLGVDDVAERVGYESSATFSKAFKRYIGAAPAAYRRSSCSSSQTY